LKVSLIGRAKRLILKSTQPDAASISRFILRYPNLVPGTTRRLYALRLILVTWLSLRNIAHINGK